MDLPFVTRRIQHAYEDGKTVGFQIGFMRGFRKGVEDARALDEIRGGQNVSVSSGVALRPFASTDPHLPLLEIEVLPPRLRAVKETTE